MQTALFLLVVSPMAALALRALPQDTAPKPEVVMSPGMRITATTSTGTITITAGQGFTRSYTWEGATRSVDMDPREERWYGSLGLTYPGPGEHWKMHNGITRGVLEEGQQHFATKALATAWLKQEAQTIPLVYRDDGLAVGWSKVLPRRQLNVEVWQIFVKGKKPLRLAGSHSRLIVVGKAQPEVVPLVRAVSHRDPTAVQALLQRGASPNVNDSLGVPVIVVAAKNADTAIVRALLDKGAAPDRRDLEGSTALLKAAEKGHVEVVKLLLQHRANTELALKSGDLRGITPLIMAILGRNLQIAELLLNKGANVHAVDGNGWSPLAYSAINGQPDAAQLLLKHGADVNERSWTGTTPLILAAHFGQARMVKLLIARGANVNAREDARLMAYGSAAFEVGGAAYQKKGKQSGETATLHEDGESALQYALAPLRADSSSKQIVDMLRAAGARE